MKDAVELQLRRACDLFLVVNVVSTEVGRFFVVVVVWVFLNLPESAQKPVDVLPQVC